MRTTIPRGLRAALLVMAVAAPVAAATRAHDRAPKTVALSGTYGRPFADSGVVARVRVVDSLVEATVRAQGFAVVPRDTVDAFEKLLTDSLGGIYDPVTGKRDSARAGAIEVAVRRGLAARHGAELWLHPFLTVEGVPFYGGEAKWRGVSEKTGALGGVGGVLLGTKSGRIPALSLLAFVEDTTGRTVYRGGGGIQLLMKAGGYAKKPSQVPPDQVLADRALVERAVHLALDSLSARVGVERGTAPRADR